MKASKTTTIAMAVMVILVLIGFVFAYRTAKWAFGRVRAVQASESKMQMNGSASHASDQEQPQLPRSDAMSRAFRSGQLPQPMPAPAGDPDQIAAELAKRVLAKDDQSTSALLAAIQMSGLSVRTGDGSISITATQSSQGLAFPDWEVAAMAKLFGEGEQIHLARFSQALLGDSPKTKDIPLAKLLIADIVADAQAQSQPMRFWARFIVELGKQRSQPMDLLSADVDPDKVRLDPIQFSFMVLRLVGDALIEKRHLAPSESSIRQNVNPSHVVLMDAAWHPDHQPRLIYTADEASSSSDTPCSLTEEEGTIQDLQAVGLGYFYATLAKYLKSIGLEDLAEMLDNAGKINGVLTVLRFFLIESALNVDITMDAPELVRTKTTTEGETRHLTAAISFNWGNWQALNCLRTATNMGGLDLGNIPTDAGGAGVEWKLVEGGDPRGAMGVLQDLWNGELGQDAGQFVGLKAPNDGEDNSYIMNRTADEHGIAKMDVVGTPQLQDLSDKKLDPIKREMAIEIGVKIKNANTGNKLFGEGLDLLNSLLLVATDDPSSPANLATETMYRCHCFKSPTFRFPVKDWAVSGLWTGGIVYSTSYKNDAPPHNVVLGPGAGRTDQISDESHQSVTVNFIPEPSAVSGGQLVTGTTGWAETRTQHSTGYQPGCSWKTDSQKTDEMTPQNFTGIAIVAATGGSPLKYSVNINLSGEAVSTSSMTGSDSGCPGHPGQTFNSPPQQSKGRISPPYLEFQGTADPQHPDVIHLDSSSTDQWGRQTTITGNLKMQ